MSGNTFGKVFKVTTFGESHGTALGCVIDGCPAGINIDQDFLNAEMERRRPGAKKDQKLNAAVTARNEADAAQIVSGIFEGKSTGTPIAILIYNQNQHSSDYNNIKDKFRPGHADFTYFEKYGIRDYRGGGRSSGRETCARVAAGAIAKMYLASMGIKIKAYTKRAAGVSCTTIDYDEIEKNNMRCPDKAAAEQMQSRIEEIRKNGDSAGGIIECVITGVKAGLGEPVFDKLDAVLSQAVMSIGAVKGIEFGCGFECADLLGSQDNDNMTQGGNFATNNAGGILGGISRGDSIIFRAAVKPVPSIFKKQHTVDTSLNECDILIEGRHDVCLCPRIVPVIEAMSALTIADMDLRNRSSRV